MKAKLLLLLVSVMALFASCSSSPDVETNEIPGTADGFKLQSFSSKAQIDFGTKSISADGCSVMTLLGTTPLDGEEGTSVDLIYGTDAPQLSAVVDKSGKVLLLNRSIPGSTTTYNAHTTALACVTMHPLFAPVKGKSNFEKLVKEIEQNTWFKRLEDHVAANIANGNHPLDTSDAQIVRILEQIINGMCEDLDEVYQVYNTRAASKITMPKAGPFDVQMNGNTAIIMSSRITPMYKGRVLNSKSEVIDEFDVPSGADYGLTNLWWDGETELFVKTDYKFDFDEVDNGEYRFEFDRKNTECICDLSINLLCNSLDIMGLPLSKVNTDALRDAVSVFIVSKAAALTSMYSDGKASTMEIMEFYVCTLVPEFLQSKTFISLVGGTAAAAMAGLASKFSAIYTVYCAIRGAGNTAVRAFSALSTPWKTSFCLCKDEKGIHTCEDFMFMAGGDTEFEVTIGEIIIPKVLVVPTYSDTWRAHKVRFELMCDEGELAPTTVSVDNNSEAWTVWTVGDTKEVQQIRAYVVDEATGKPISNEIWFTAHVDLQQPVINLDFNKEFYLDADSHEYNFTVRASNASDIYVSTVFANNAQPWITASPLMFNSKEPTDLSGRVNVKIEANPDEKDRIAYIVFYASNIINDKSHIANAIVNIVQAGKKPTDEPQNPGITEMEDFYGAWTVDNAGVYTYLRFRKDMTWQRERWDTKEYSNGSKDIVLTEETHGTFTYKRSQYEQMTIQKNPNVAFLFDGNFVCTGTETPFSPKTSAAVGKSGTYTVQGVRAYDYGYNGEVFLTVWNTSDPCCLNEAGSMWNPSAYK